MTDFIVIAIVVLIVGSALGYIIRAKKRGVKCIGCSAGGNCSGHKEDASHNCCCGASHACSCCGEHENALAEK